MANTKSAKKRILVSRKKAMCNKMIKSRTKTAVKKALQSMETSSKDAGFINAVSLIDKAAAKGVMHKNTAARKKSRLARLYNKTAV